MKIEQTKLKNGITLVFDKMSDIDSVIVQVAVPVGSQNETREEGGISHFLEHMAFKGTEKRTYLQLSDEVDRVGGLQNAFTSREYTQYFIKVLKKDVELVFDILSDMLFCSSYPAEEIEKERGVILQEYAMYADDPADVNEENMYLQAYGDTAFGRPIIGTPENIKRFTRDDFINYRKKNYKTKDMIIGVCGNVEFSEVQKLADKYFGSHTIENVDYQRDEIKYIGGMDVKTKKDLEQIKFRLAFNGISHKNIQEYYAMSIGSAILGSGMSSRLFNEIREKRGLVYFVHTMTETTPDTSLFVVGAGFAPDKCHEFAPALKSELLTICDYIKDDELEKAKNQYEAAFLMSDEKSSVRVGRMIGSLMMHGRIITNEEKLQIINSITKDQIISAMSKVLSGKPTMSVYGNVAENDAELLKTTLKSMK